MLQRCQRTQVRLHGNSSLPIYFTVTFHFLNGRLCPHSSLVCSRTLSQVKVSFLIFIFHCVSSKITDMYDGTHSLDDEWCVHVNDSFTLCRCKIDQLCYSSYSPYISQDKYKYAASTASCLSYTILSSFDVVK